MVINLKDKTDKIPRNEKGDPAFECLGPLYVPTEGRFPTCPNCPAVGDHQIRTVINLFTAAEIVELVNRALYQIEYQKTSHRKRGQKLRDVEKALKEELKKQGLDVKVTEIKNQLEGKK